MATIQDIRYEIGDVDINFPMLADAEITYYLNKNESSLRRTTMDCARAILMKLSMRSDSTVDLFSIKSSKSAEQYRLALEMLIKNPDFNMALSASGIYAGGISLSDMEANVANLDNNIVQTANNPNEFQIASLSNPFVI